MKPTCLRLAASDESEQLQTPGPLAPGSNEELPQKAVSCACVWCAITRSMWLSQMQL